MDAETKRDIETLKAALFTHLEGDGSNPERIAQWYDAMARNAASADARELFTERAAVMRQKRAGRRSPTQPQDSAPTELTCPVVMTRQAL